MKKTVILYILLFSLVLQVRANFCIPSIESDLRKVIFIGKVVSKDRASLFDAYGPIVITNFQVIRSFNGINTTTCGNCDYDMNYISVLNSSSASSIDFKVDSTYIVFANRHSLDLPILWTDACTHTELLSNSDTTSTVIGESIVFITMDSIMKIVQDRYGKGFKHPTKNKGVLNWKMKQDSLTKAETLSLINQVSEFKKIKSDLTTKFYTILMVCAILTIGLLILIIQIIKTKPKNI